MLAAVKDKPSGWPLKKRPSLTATARAGSMLVQAGAEEWRQPNKGMLLGCASRRLMPLPTRFSKEAEMLKKKQTSPEPSWLDPRNDRKTPFTDAELETLADDFIARMADTPAWRDLVAEVGERQAREVAKKRLATQDANSLLNWQPGGPLH